MKISRWILLLLMAGYCAAGQAGAGMVPALQASDPVEPAMVDLGDARQRDWLAGKLAGQRAIFIGEVHDRQEHHQNQLRTIQSLYQRYPDLAIGVEYFQQPFQRYLDDYIAGRIDEREMLRKTEYYKRWQLDYRLLRPIFAFAREKHIPVLALNVPDEIHNKVFKSGMRSLTPAELAQTPREIQPASEHYLQRLQAIFNSHPPSNDFRTFVEGVLLWDEGMAEVATNYLKAHPQSRVVVLAGMVHVMYGDGIPERVDRRMGSDQSAVLINGSDFGSYRGIADYLLATAGSKPLPQPGRLGVTVMDVQDSVHISEFTANSAAQQAGIRVGDTIAALDGIRVANMAELKTEMFDKQPGDTMQVTVRRNSVDTELNYEVTLR